RLAQIVREPRRLGFGYSSRQGRQGREVTGQRPVTLSKSKDLRRISLFVRNDIVLPLRPLRALREIFRNSVAAVPRYALRGKHDNLNAAHKSY
ncbi:MAG: hypothetical protein ACXWYD_20845, partial [Candidatus Binatia bacterium]